MSDGGLRMLTIFADEDLEPQVVAALDRAQVEGFLRLGQATGNRFLAEGQVPRSIAWEAVAFVVPLATAEQQQSIALDLSRDAHDCGAEACLRIVASPVTLLA